MFVRQAFVYVIQDDRRARNEIRQFVESERLWRARFAPGIEGMKAGFYSPAQILPTIQRGVLPTLRQERDRLAAHTSVLPGRNQTVLKNVNQYLLANIEAYETQVRAFQSNNSELVQKGLDRQRQAEQILTNLEKQLADEGSAGSNGKK